MEAWMKSLGLAISISELGVNKDMIDGIIEGVFILDGGYIALSKEEIKGILINSL